MAATVVLTFPKSSDAAKFVRTLYAENPVYDAIGSAAFTGEVAAVVRRPTEWCQCVGQQNPVAGGRRRRSRPSRELSWTRDPKTGWFVCIHCGNPSKAMVVHATSVMLVGQVDHLPKILGIGEPRTLFEQRVMEVVEFALAEGTEPDIESLSEYERMHVASTPNGQGDTRFGRTAVNPGVSTRSRKVARAGKRQRPRRASA